MGLLKVKCLIICRQIFLYLFVSRLVRVKRRNPKNILNSFILLLIFPFFFFWYPPFSILAYEMLNYCTKSSNSITIIIQFNHKIFKPYFMVLTFCGDMQFSIRDRDNDIKPNSSCAQGYKDAQWYSDCHQSNLNGLHLSGCHSSRADGVNWWSFIGYYYLLKRTEIKAKQISVLVSFLFFYFSRRDQLGPDHGHNTLQLSILFVPVSRRIFIYLDNEATHWFIDRTFEPCTAVYIILGPFSIHPVEV